MNGLPGNLFKWHPSWRVSTDAGEGRWPLRIFCWTSEDSQSPEAQGCGGMSGHTTEGSVERPFIESPPYPLADDWDRIGKGDFSPNVLFIIVFVNTQRNIGEISVKEWAGTSPLRCKHVIYGVLTGSSGETCIIDESNALRIANQERSVSMWMTYILMDITVGFFCCGGGGGGF